MNPLIIFDTTLRDGEQSPGASMTKEEKVRIAKMLERMRVDVIEAGFPIASPGDFEAVRAVARVVKDSIVCGLARAADADIDRAGEALQEAAAGRIHTFIATSPIHMQMKLRLEPDQVVERAVEAVRRARRWTDDVEFSAEDAGRSELDFLCRITEAVIKAGARTINIPDTVGYNVPDQFAHTIRSLIERVPNADQAIFSVHCHNDLGLAVANSLAAVRNGARGVECTINGLGERAGNCSLEEVVMGLKVRGDAFGRLWTSVKTRELYRTSRLVSQMSGMVVQRNKAIVGANAFAHEAGIHQDGILKERTTYEIMRPEEVGISGSDMVLGKHSGRHALFVHLGRMGFQVAEDQKESVYNQFKELCDKKKYIYDDDLIAIMRERISDIPQVYTLDYFHVATGTSTVPTATVRLKKGEEVFQDSACGDGPVDATLKTIDRITGTPGTLEDYSLQAVTRGEDAVGEVSVTVAFGKDMVSAKAASTDIVEASAKAYLNALNSHLFAQQTAKGPKKKAAGRRQGRQP